MSGIAHAIKKVFKAVGSVVKKIWKPLVVAAAIYFTGGAALGALGAMSTGGSLLAGAGAGLEAAAGGIGIGAGAGIGSAFGAGAGLADAAAGIGGATLGAGAADVGAGLMGPGDAVAGDLGLGGSAAGTGGFETLGGGGVLSGSGGDLAGQLANPAAADIPTAITKMPGAVELPGDPSPLWQDSLNMAGKIMTTPGMPSLIGGLLQSYNQANMLDAQMKWANERAPGQITGGTKGAWTGIPNSNANTNASNMTPMPGAGVKPLPLNPVPLTQVQPGPLPGYGQPGGAQQNYPGYGTPGYGQQPPQQPQQPQQYPYQQQQGGLMSTPFIDSPYDQSYG